MKTGAKFLLAAGVVLGACSPQGTRSIRDLHVESFTPDLLIDPSAQPFWIDQNQLIITAMQPGAEVMTASRESFMARRVMLINVANKSIKTVDADGQYYWGGGGRKFYSGKLHQTFPYHNGEPLNEYLGFKLWDVDASGEIKLVSQIAPGSPLPDRNAWKKELNLPENSFVITLNQRFGALASTVDVSRDKSNEGYFNSKTWWYRPGKPPLLLDVPFSEIHSPVYIEFLDKYLLNSSDSAGSSDTSKALRTFSKWNHDYELSPFRLLGMDGSVEVFPYPKFIRQYGLESPGDPHNRPRNFYGILFTKPGILIDKQLSTTTAFYLYKQDKDQLYLIKSGKGLFGLNTDSVSMSAEREMTLSPDGCRLAYLHINGPDTLPTLEYHLTILDLCKED